MDTILEVKNDVHTLFEIPSIHIPLGCLIPSLTLKKTGRKQGILEFDLRLGTPCPSNDVAAGFIRSVMTTDTADLGSKRVKNTFSDQNRFF